MAKRTHEVMQDVDSDDDIDEDKLFEESSDDAASASDSLEDSSDIDSDDEEAQRKKKQRMKKEQLMRGEMYDDDDEEDTKSVPPSKIQERPVKRVRQPTAAPQQPPPAAAITAAPQRRCKNIYNLANMESLRAIFTKPPHTPSALVNKLVVLAVVSSNCNACRLYEANDAHKFHDKFLEVIFAYVDVAKSAEMAGAVQKDLHVRSTPTFVMVKNGTVLATVVGSDVQTLYAMIMKCVSSQ